MDKTLNDCEMQANGLSYATKFSEGLAFVSKGDKSCFINKKGEDAFPSLDLEDACPFSDGYAVVITKDPKLGYLNKDGLVLTGGREFKMIYSFSEGMAFAKYVDSDEWVCIDKDLNELFSTGNLEPVSGFVEGYALVRKEKTLSNTDYIWLFPDPFDDVTKDETEDAQGLQSADGMSFDFVEDDYSFLFGDDDVSISAIPAENETSQDNEKEYEYNFIDKEGNLLLPNWCDAALPFAEGFAVVCIDVRYEGTDMSSGNQYNFIDKSGKLLLKSNVNYAKSFSEGIAVVALDSDSGGLSFSWCYVDKSGKFVMPFKPRFLPGSLPDKLGHGYSYATPFNEGVACIGWSLADAMDGELIDREGNVLHSFEQDRTNFLFGYSEGLAGFALLEFLNINKEIKQFYMDKSGKEMFENMHFDEIHPFSEGMAVVRIGDRYYYIDKCGNILKINY